MGDSSLIGLHFIGPNELRARLGGVTPAQLRKVLTKSFQQRRKTLRNSVKKLVLQEICGGDKEMCKDILDSKPLPLSAEAIEARQRGDPFALTQELPDDWAKKEARGAIIRSICRIDKINLLSEYRGVRIEHR